MGKKILLADDSITIQKVIELTFSDEDFDVVTVGNGRLALEKVQEVRPDLVLCDIIMPEKDGYEVCDVIKKNPATAQIPVLLLTGAFEPFDQERANRVGCDGFLAKPFEPQTLVAKVKELLNQARPPASRPAAATATAAPPPAPVAAPTPAFTAPPAYTPPPVYTPPPAPAFTEPEPSDLTPPVPFVPPPPAPSAFIPEEPQDLYGAMDTVQEEPLVPVTTEESATLRDTPAPSDNEFGSWSQATIEVPLEMRAQASVEAAQDEPLFEEVFEDEPAKAPARPAPSPTATASYAFDRNPSTEDTAGTIAYSPSEAAAFRTAPVPPPPSAPAPAPAAPSWPPPAATAPPAPVPPPAAAPLSFADVTPPPASAPASVAAEMPVPKEMVETIAQRVVAQISEKIVREIAWEVIPDLAEALIKQEIERLKAELPRT